VADFLQEYLQMDCMKNPIFVTVFVTVYLVIYCVLTQIAATEVYAFYMFLASPAFVIWMVMTVLKDRRFTSRSLGDREFGYRDKLNL